MRRLEEPISLCRATALAVDLSELIRAETERVKAWIERLPPGVDFPDR